jgi:hypothetical protein
MDPHTEAVRRSAITVLAMTTPVVREAALRQFVADVVAQMRAQMTPQVLHVERDADGMGIAARPGTTGDYYARDEVDAVLAWAEEVLG